MSIIKPSTAFKANADWVSADVRSYMADQTPFFPRQFGGFENQLLVIESGPTYRDIQ